MVPALVRALPLDAATAAAAVSALCALCSTRRALNEFVDADGLGALLAAVGRLSGRGHQLAVKLLRRLAKSSSSVRVRVQDVLVGVGAAGLPLTA